MSISISKANFNESKYGMTFEQLDINKDGVIDKSDLNNTTNSEVKNVISKMLNSDKDEDAA